MEDNSIYTTEQVLDMMQQELHDVSVEKQEQEFRANPYTRCNYAI